MTNPPAAVTAATAIRRRSWSLETRLTLALAVMTLLSVGAILGVTFWIHRTFTPPHRTDFMVSSIYPMGAFTVNLLDAAVLRVSISLEFVPAGADRSRALSRDELGARLEQLQRRISDSEARYRDGIIQILTGKRSNAVLTPGGKEALKAEILEELNGRELPGGQFSGIFFTEFMLQKAVVRRP